MSSSEDRGHGSDRAEVSQLLIKWKKKGPKILTEFGASLRSSGGPDGEHSLVGVDWSGLACKAGFRNNDIIEAVNAAEFKIKDVGHRSLAMYLREEGQTCSMLVRRQREDGTNFCWIAFRVKDQRGKPIIGKKAKQNVGSDINQAEGAYFCLPNWARSVSAPLKLLYQSTKYIRLSFGEESGTVSYLGFFHSEPCFTAEDFVLSMHTYQSIYEPLETLVVAFSAIPRATRGRLRETGCLDVFRRNDTDNENQSDDDDDDDDAYDEDTEACLWGDSKGPIEMKIFPKFMTGGEEIIVNPMMFALPQSDDGTFMISPASRAEEKLYVTVSNGKLYLGHTRSIFKINAADDSLSEPESSEHCSNSHNNLLR